jgi:hypothetical protein
VCERLVVWALVGNFHQPCPRGVRYVALNGDVAGDLADVAFPGFAIGTVLRMDLATRQSNREPLGGEPLAVGIERIVIEVQAPSAASR